MKRILLAGATSLFLILGANSSALDSKEPMVLEEIVEEKAPLENILKIEPRAKNYIEPVYKACQKTYTLGEEKFTIDPLMVLALIKHESSFRQFAVSSYGAAGAYQFMPHIAWGMGMKVYIPETWVLAWIKEYGNQEEEIQNWLKENGKSQAYFTGSREFYKLADNYFHEGKIKEAQGALEKARDLHNESQAEIKKYRRDLIKKIKSMTDEELNEFDQRFLLDTGAQYCVDYLIKSDQEFYQFNLDVYDIGIKHDPRVLIASYHAGLPNVLEGGGVPLIPGSIKYQNEIYRTYYKYKEFFEANE